MSVGLDALIVPDGIISAPTPIQGSCTSDDSCVTLLDGGVRTAPYAVLSSVGSTPVLAPDYPPAVSAVLVAPQV